MTHTDLHDALHAIGETVSVPAPDAAAFRVRVGRARRRRTVTRGAVGALAAAAVVTAGWAALPGHDGSGPDVATDPGPAPSLHGVLVFAEHGRLATTRPAAPMVEVDSGIAVEEVLAVTPQGVVFVDRQSHVRLAAVDPDGTVGEPRDLVGEPVQQAGVDKAGTTLWFVDLDDVLHRRDLGSSADTSATAVDPAVALLAVGRDRWVESRADSLALRTGAASYDVTTAFPAVTAELGGSTLAVTTIDGTELFEAADGARRYGSLGGSVASLSPDGRFVASGSGQADVDVGMSPGVWLVDTGKGKVLDVALGDDTGAVGDVWWADDEHYFVVMSTPNADLGHPLHMLYECTVASLACQARIEDESGTLALPSS